jgi:hypothetical protein
MVCLTVGLAIIVLLNLRWGLIAADFKFYFYVFLVNSMIRGTVLKNNITN